MPVDEKWMDVRKNQSQYCATCGKKRGPLEPQRRAWGSNLPTARVPLIEGNYPWESIGNSLIVSACVYRNGGPNDECHLCDDCLRIGLRDIKTEVDRMLEVVEAGADKDAEIADLQRRLAKEQHTVWLARLERDNALSREREAIEVLAGMK